MSKKYYLSNKMINCFMSDTKMGDITRKDRFLQNINRENQEIANSITTLNGSRVTDTFITNLAIKNAQQIGYIEKGTGQHQSNTIYYGENISPCLNASDYKEAIKILIKNNTKQGYLEAKEGDCIDLCQPSSKTRRGRVQKDKSQTITTMGGEHLGVIVNGRITNKETNT